MTQRKKYDMDDVKALKLKCINDAIYLPLKSAYVHFNLQAWYDLTETNEQIQLVYNLGFNFLLNPAASFVSGVWIK